MGHLRDHHQEKFKPRLTERLSLFQVLRKVLQLVWAVNV